jgi:CubicO group peptidase (beta-lactamase class C family)
MDASPSRPEEGESATHSYPPIDDLDLKATVAQILDCWPCGGLAVGVIADGGLAWFHGHGVADVGAKAPITEDTVFRIGSITKTFTAIAVMQLWERGLVDLDAPANDYLRSFRLILVRPNVRPATVRHLLTHTAGVGYWRRVSDLLQPGVGSGVRAARSGAPPLEDYYRRGLPVEVEPGTKWAYSNHGFAALGQIVGPPIPGQVDRFVTWPGRARCGVRTRAASRRRYRRPRRRRTSAPTPPPRPGQTSAMRHRAQSRSRRQARC